MKKFVLFALAMLALSAPASAQKPTFFSGVQCQQALAAGNFSYYQPRFFNNRDKNPVDGKLKVALPLEANACVHAFTTAGWQWVVLPAGTKLRWEGKRLYAMDACGNAADDIAYAPVQVVAPPTPTATAPATATAVCCESVTRADLLDAAGHIAAGMVRTETTIAASPRRGRCGLGCKIGIGLLTGGVLYAATRGGGGDHEQVTTLPPCTHLPCN